MSMEKAGELVESIEDLPTLPEVVIGITQLVDDPDATAEDIYRIVSTDPALSATMLKLVNSAFYGMSRSVTSLEEAIRILGFVTVRNIALAAFVFDAFLTGKGQFDYKGFWMHSIGCATAAKVLAQRLHTADSGEYFVHGLLHDLGQIVLMQYSPEHLQEVIELIRQGRDVGEAERDVLGCTHQEAGAVLAEKWEFPPSLVAVISGHAEAVDGGEFEREVAVTTCASTVAQALEIGSTLPGKLTVVHEKTWRAADVMPADIGGIMDQVIADMDNARSFVSLLYT